MKIYCCCCGKQAVNYPTGPNSPYVTELEGGRTGFKIDECFCRFCAEDMDENGLFPEEAEEAKMIF